MFVDGTKWAVVLLGISLPAHADYAVSLKVPLTPQQNDYYCGAASSQMTMTAYPAVSSHKCVQQDEIYNRIQHFKKDSGFYSDPDGIKDAVMDLDPPPAGGSFVIISDADRAVVMHNALSSMSDRSYPTVVLVNGGDHWVVITGFRTDIDPRTGNAVLQELQINDPWPVATSPNNDPCTSNSGGGGAIRTVTGSSWYKHDWKVPNHYGKKWPGKYVAVVGTALAQGTVTAKDEVAKERLIPATEAVKRAQDYVMERKLAERHAELQQAKATRALLVNRQQDPYFLVPFETEGGRSRFVVLLDAHSGDLEEFGVLNEPVHYLNEIDALFMARSTTIATTQVPLTGAATELVYSPSLQMKNRYLPVWKVTLTGETTSLTRYVTTRGEVLSEITAPPMGGQ
jgi:hypothetical protein